MATVKLSEGRLAVALIFELSYTGRVLRELAGSGTRSVGTEICSSSQSQQ